MMGQGLERLEGGAPAGSVVAVGGLETSILKSATLVADSHPSARPLAPLLFQTAAIVRAAVEPTLPSQLPQLLAGLRLLNRAGESVLGVLHWQCRGLRR